MHRGDSFEEVAGGVLALTLFLAVILAVFLAKLLVAMVQELGRIYLESGPLPEKVKRTLWLALVVFALLTVVCLSLAAITSSAAPLAIYLVCWGFLAFVVVIETAEWWGRRTLGPPTLDSYLPGPHGMGLGGMEQPAEAIA